ncbi:MAG: acyltransferase domain-containing protein [Clostridia bacterium]|nr:acyltransferase domain-containing protein [Clostridia bacterium]
MRRDYLQGFYKRFDFPDEAIAALNADFDKIAADENAWAKFLSPVIKYEEGKLDDFMEGVDEAVAAAKTVGVHQYSADMLFICLLTEQLEKNFKRDGKPDEVYYDATYDIHCKLIECYKLHKIWGTCVIGWYPGLFEGYRYAFGRLQFEDIVHHGPDRVYRNSPIKDGEHFLVIHIPSRGRLDHDDVLASYKGAYEYFKGFREDGLVPAFTDSWLLDTSLPWLLPADSNIVKFAKDFRIYRVEKDDFDRFPDVWRVYYADCIDNDLEDYPEDTTLKREIKKYLMNGGRIGNGFGYVVMGPDGLIK